MPQLKAVFGVMGSGKTAELLETVQKGRLEGREIRLIKPGVDTRFGVDVIRSRNGNEAQADIVVSVKTDLLRDYAWDGVGLVLVDEAQFLSIDQVDQLRELSGRVEVICYGLKTNFKTKLFEGSGRAFEVADVIRELVAPCHFCKSKNATQHVRHVDGKPTLQGPDILVGAEESYFPACFPCYKEQIGSVREPVSVKVL